ncbi:MAG: guanylate kinase [Micrococcales bacterium]|nr:guanylate kinase [Micrococcales bacterium]
MTRLTVIAGPTAVGKGTVVREILAMHPEIQLSISVTTRPPRPSEIDGVHYHFVSPDEFDRMIAGGELLEYATVHKLNQYGTPRRPVEVALASGKQIILEIDIQGARQIKKSMPTANLIFISPPTEEDLVKRLASRGTEDDEEIKVRLATARLEMASAGEFDHIVVNHEVAQCAKEVLELMQAN